MRKNYFLLILITAILIGFVPVIFIYLKPENEKKETSETLRTKIEEVREIIVSASKFEYSPSIIAVKRGERIKLIINNTDTLHGITIPELGISGDDFVEFVVDKEGEFAWYCNNFCGQGHRQMQGKLIVE